MDVNSSSSHQSTSVVTVKPKSPFSEGHQELTYYKIVVGQHEQESKEKAQQEEKAVITDPFQDLNLHEKIVSRASEYCRGDFSFDEVARPTYYGTDEENTAEFKRALDAFIRQKLFQGKSIDQLKSDELTRYYAEQSWIINEVSVGSGSRFVNEFLTRFPLNESKEPQFILKPALPGGRALIDYDPSNGFKIYKRFFRPIYSADITPPEEKGSCNLYMLQSQKASLATIYLETTGLKAEYVKGKLTSDWEETTVKALSEGCVEIASPPQVLKRYFSADKKNFSTELKGLYSDKYKELNDIEREELHGFISATMPKHLSDKFLKDKIAEYLGQRPTEEILRKFYFEKYPYLSTSEKKDLNKLVVLTEPKAAEYLDIAVERGLGFWQKFFVKLRELGAKINSAFIGFIALGGLIAGLSMFIGGPSLLVGALFAATSVLTYLVTILTRAPLYHQVHDKELVYSPEDVSFRVRFVQKFNELHGFWRGLTSVVLSAVFVATAVCIAGVFGAFPGFFASLPNLVLNTSSATFAVAGALSMMLIFAIHALRTSFGSEPGGEKIHVLAGGADRQLAWTSASHSLAMISQAVSSSVLANASLASSQSSLPSASLASTSAFSQAEVLVTPSSSIPQVSMSGAAVTASSEATLPNQVPEEALSSSGPP
ncbi:MAG: hypothetical protein M1561_08255 [Gammaproteobacteria bacterium]|nr:hypothetical protein [Gammaproteobacteria bacterium]